MLKDNIRKALKIKSWKVKKLADISGLPKRTIDSWLAGIEPSVSSCFKMTKALGVSVEFLVTGKEHGGLSADETAAVALFRAVPKRAQRFAMRLLEAVAEYEKK
jgi:transcriptional regulator with XRE-family HTH domain